MSALGNLQVLDVRTVWSNEARDFTPWIASEEGIGLLGDALGIELEVEDTEVSVGPFSADLVARDTANEGFVVVENQLGKTDHDHLGKSITYASVLGASTVVWIAAEFTEEHRRALEWLNDNSSDDVSFYGVQPELWQIDDSRPALRLNVVARPAQTVRRAALRRASTDLSEGRRLQLEWWQAFRDQLVAQGIVRSGQTPRAQYWYNISLGRAGINLSNTANTSDGRIGVRLYLRGRHGGDVALEQLMSEREEIQREIGEPLVWNPHPEKKDKTISVQRDAELADRGKWAEYLTWMADMTGRFIAAFRPRLRSMDLTETENGDDADETQD